MTTLLHVCCVYTLVQPRLTTAGFCAEHESPLLQIPTLHSHICLRSPALPTSTRASTVGERPTGGSGGGSGVGGGGGGGVRPPAWFTGGWLPVPSEESTAAGPSRGLSPAAGGGPSDGGEPSVFKGRGQTLGAPCCPMRCVRPSPACMSTCAESPCYVRQGLAWGWCSPPPLLWRPQAVVVNPVSWGNVGRPYAPPGAPHVSVYTLSRVSLAPFSTLIMM